MIHRSRRVVRLRTALLIGLLLLTGLAPIVPTAVDAARYPSTALANSIPATPAGDQLAWALAQINDGGADLTDSAIKKRFTKSFLSALPPDDLIAVFTDYLAPYGPMRVARLEGGANTTRANALLIAADGQPWRVRLTIEGDEPHRIDDLYFEPAYQPAPMEKPPGSWKTFDKQIAKVAPEVGFIAAEVTDGTCQPIQAVNADQELAIGSAFKLYVLGELARQIEAGEASWDESLAVQADLKSLPTGNLLYEPDGSEFPLVSYAERMISESDNTATDHLIARLGREKIEAMMATMGHANPERNLPLLMTREWFAIKLRLSDKEIARYIAADDETQRQTLAERVDPEANTLWDGEEWVTPYLIDSIEWFASAADLCRATAYLHEASGHEGLGPIQDCLSLDPGIAFDPAIWTYVGYKGGYETGVKSHVWLLQRQDGRWFMMAAIINDPAKEINGAKLNGLMLPAAKFLAKAK